MNVYVTMCVMLWRGQGRGYDLDVHYWTLSREHVNMSAAPKINREKKKKRFNLKQKKLRHF